MPRDDENLHDHLGLLLNLMGGGRCCVVWWGWCWWGLPTLSPSDQILPLTRFCVPEHGG